MQQRCHDWRRLPGRRPGSRPNGSTIRPSRQPCSSLTGADSIAPASMALRRKASGSSTTSSVLPVAPSMARGLNRLMPRLPQSPKIGRSPPPAAPRCHLPPPLDAAPQHRTLTGKRRPPSLHPPPTTEARFRSRSIPAGRVGVHAPSVRARRLAVPTVHLSARRAPAPRANGSFALPRLCSPSAVTQAPPSGPSPPRPRCRFRPPRRSWARRLGC
jgi:hypothetical protein